MKSSVKKINVILGFSAAALLSAALIGCGSRSSGSTGSDRSDAQAETEKAETATAGSSAEESSAAAETESTEVYPPLGQDEGDPDDQTTEVYPPLGQDEGDPDDAEGSGETTSGGIIMSSSDSDFDSLLEEACSQVHPGTAGSSLTGAYEAANLMNWYTDTLTALNPDASREDLSAAITEASRTWFSGHSGDAEERRDSIDLMYSSAKDSLTEDGAGLLEDAGYHGQVNWTEDDVETVFPAILAAL